MQIQGQQIQGQGQQGQGDDDLFRGIYVGTNCTIRVHLEEIDPNERMFPGVRDYIAKFPLTREYFSRMYPFFNGSKVRDETINDIYDTAFVTFVQMFKLNHPDWNEYSDDECLQHFVHFIEINPDPTEYHVEQNERTNAYRIRYRRELNETPPTHEKPHFRTYEIESDDARFVETYIGSGYFRNVDNEDVPYHRQMGIWGPNGVSRFFLYERITLLERYLGGVDQELDFLPSIQLRLSDGTPFDISLDSSEERNHARFIENETDDLFLFEESLQNERMQRRMQTA